MNIKKIMTVGLVTVAAMLQAVAAPSVEITEAWQAKPGSGVVDFTYKVSDVGGEIGKTPENTAGGTIFHSDTAAKWRLDGSKLKNDSSGKYLLVQGKSNRVVGYRHGEFVDFDIDDIISDYESVVEERNLKLSAEREKAEKLEEERKYDRERYDAEKRLKRRK